MCSPQRKNWLPMKKEELAVNHCYTLKFNYWYIKPCYEKKRDCKYLACNMHQQTLGGGGNNKPSLIDRIEYRKLMVVTMFIFPLSQVQILYFPFCHVCLIKSCWFGRVNIAWRKIIVYTFFANTMSKICKFFFNGTMTQMKYSCLIIN